MGAVAEMLRRRERRDTRKGVSWQELLWVLPIGAAFLAGAYLIPRTESRWLNALLWAGLGALIMVLVLLSARIARRVLRRPAPTVTFPMRYAFFVTVLFCLDALFPERLWGDQGLRVLAMSVVGGCICGLALWLALRRQRRTAASQESVRLRA